MPLHHRCTNAAAGGPGAEPRWTHGDKDAVGTAYSTSSPLWFTVSRGLVNELYYPTVDGPQLRDLQYLITDGESFLHDECHDCSTEVEPLSRYCLGVRIVNSPASHDFRIVTEIISYPYQPCLLMRSRLEGDPALLARLRVYVYCRPHLEGAGKGNTGEVLDLLGVPLLAAHKEGTLLALGASIPFSRCSCGYVGVNDGWTDLARNYRMEWEYDCAVDGSIALMGELALGDEREWTLALAFGRGHHNATTTLFQALAIPFEEHRKNFLDQWEEAHDDHPASRFVTFDEGALYRRSHSLLLAHEDKRFPGAMVASLSIPWGDSKGDEEGSGGYHLVWTRDLVQSATGLLASGNSETPLRSLIYLALAQKEDGGFHQNFWVSGEPFWKGVQLDLMAFPILLAWRLDRLDALQHFDPYPMVCRAARYLLLNGPLTQQDRWETSSGYSPSTPASNIAALICAASLVRARGDDESTRFIEEYAGFLECHLEE